MASAAPASIFFNARVRGMRSHLLSRERIEEMLQQNDLQRMIDALLESPYRVEMAEALTRRHGADAVEEALLRNLVSTFHNLIGRAQGEQRTLVEMFLTRWDLDAVKSLLRLRHQQVPVDESAQGLIPGPGLPLPVLQELAKRDDMESLIGALASWNSRLCRGLLQALPRYRDTNDVGVLEEALDNAYFVTSVRRLRLLASADAKALRVELAAEIDRINLRTLFQAIQVGGDRGPAVQRLLPEGTLSASLLQSMAAAADAPAAIEQLAGTRYQSLLNEILPFLQTRRFSPVERHFDRVLVTRMRHLAHQRVFGIGLMMHFVWLKHNEIVNLRLVARGLAGNLPAGRVREELYFAH
jgi:vacuolar-type H+-ATPase subunit C/Vma6